MNQGFMPGFSADTVHPTDAVWLQGICVFVCLFEGEMDFANYLAQSL